MLRKITSLTLAWMFLLSAISGIMLFIAPPGRIAYWADWSILSLSKGDWDHLHTVITIVMIFVVGLHLYYNWKPFISYMKDKIKKTLSLTKELIISLLITIALAVGSIAQVPPFVWIIDIGDYISEDWEVTYGTPPYNHAELDTIKQFCKRLNINVEKAEELLTQNKISYTDDATLLEISNNNGKSPQEIYTMIVGKKESNKLPPIEGSGMGKKTLEQICKLRGLDIEKVKETLTKKGLTVKPNDKFKEIAEVNNISPIELLQMVE